MRYDFTIEVAGKTYKCWREVNGDRVKSQRIYVLNMGENGDLALYGEGHFDVAFMSTTAQHIAQEIIEDYLAKTPGVDMPPRPPAESE